MYNDYIHYITNRKKDLEKLKSIFPQNTDTINLTIEACDAAVRMRNFNDMIKKGIEAYLGHEIEHAEVDIYMMLFGSLMVQNDPSLMATAMEPEVMVKQIWLKLGTILNIPQNLLEKAGNESAKTTKKVLAHLEKFEEDL